MLAHNDRRNVMQRKEGAAISISEEKEHESGLEKGARDWTRKIKTFDREGGFFNEEIRLRNGKKGEQKKRFSC